ncbi:MAG TPA: hypothetical protein VL460_03845 [Caulobacteraceae bacterium]|jgi:hypothetical protein|nr:hypothetical protein [Caulobacteraceae bacterium]
MLGWEDLSADQKLTVLKEKIIKLHAALEERDTRMVELIRRVAKLEEDQVIVVG